MKVVIFIGLKLIELCILSLVWWIPWWVGKTKIAIMFNDTRPVPFKKDSNGGRWARGAYIILLFTLASFIVIVVGSLLVYGTYIVCEQLINANWDLASQIAKGIK